VSLPLRRLTLTVHVMVSVGWLGLTLALLTLGVEGRAARDRAAYGAMRVLADVLIVPVALVALVTGVLLGVGTRWGLIRHWWVAAKLVLTLAAAASIFALRPLTHEAAANGGAGMTGISAIVAPSVALTVYGTATVLSVYKPWGRMPALFGPAAQTRSNGSG
jgi:hypothetical protein